MVQQMGRGRAGTVGRHGILLCAAWLATACLCPVFSVLSSRNLPRPPPPACLSPAEQAEYMPSAGIPPPEYGTPSEKRLGTGVRAAQANLLAPGSIMKKRIAFFGTCQLVHLASLLSRLPGWTERYETDRILRVDRLTSEQYRHFLLNCETADILCVQPVQAEHFYEARTECVLDYARRHGKRVIIIPYVYFSGYAPHMIYAHTNVGEYHCAASVACMVAKLNIPEAQRTVADFFRRPQEFFLHTASSSLGEMLRRERLLQGVHDECVPLYAWFTQNFQQTRLMHTHNHPAPVLFRYLLRELAGRLDLEADDTPLPEDFLHDDDIFPVHWGVQATLHLAPELVSPLLRDGGRIYTLEETVGRCLSHLYADRASLLVTVRRRLSEIKAIFQAMFGRPLPMRPARGKGLNTQT